MLVFIYARVCVSICATAVPLLTWPPASANAHAHTMMWVPPAHAAATPAAPSGTERLHCGAAAVPTAWAHPSACTSARTAALQPANPVRARRAKPLAFSAMRSTGGCVACKFAAGGRGGRGVLAGEGHLVCHPLVVLHGGLGGMGR